MRALITGGAGFIGQWTARRMAPAWELTALDILAGQVHLDAESSVRAFPGQVVRGDVSDTDAWRRVPRPDVVIHLAAETGTAQSMYEVDRYRHVNVDGTRLAAEMAALWGVPIIATSSRAVYGEGRYRHADGSISVGATEDPDAVPEASREDDAHRPVSVYGETKSDGEALLGEAAAAIPVTIIRPQNVVGPGQALHNPYTGVLAAFLARLREGKSLAVYGDGSATRDFIHVEDLATLIAWSVEYPPSVGAPLILNSGTGVRTTLDELAEAAIAGSPRADVEIEHVRVQRAGDIEHACADLARLASVGAPKPRWTSRDAIADFIS